MRATQLKAVCLVLLALPLGACGDTAPGEIGKEANPALGARWQFPREREVEGRTVIVHAPQIRSWDGFKQFTAQVAVETTEPDAAARYAVIDLSGATDFDREARIVRVAKPQVDRVSFSGGTGSAEQEARIRNSVENEPLEIPLDVFLYYLADGVLEAPPPAGFNDEPPPIYVVESPAFLLFVNGEPVAEKVGDSGLEMIVNANFPVFRDSGSGSYYLLTGDHRYMAAKPTGPWGTVAELPPSFSA